MKNKQNISREEIIEALDNWVISESELLSAMVDRILEENRVSCKIIKSFWNKHIIHNKEEKYFSIIESNWEDNIYLATNIEHVRDTDVDNWIEVIKKSPKTIVDESGSSWFTITKNLRAYMYIPENWDIKTLRAHETMSPLGQIWNFVYFTVPTKDKRGSTLTISDGLRQDTLKYRMLNLKFIKLENWLTIVCFKYLNYNGVREWVYNLSEMNLLAENVEKTVVNKENNTVSFFEPTGSGWLLKQEISLILH